jgi:hypothetical protein
VGRGSKSLETANFIIPLKYQENKHLPKANLPTDKQVFRLFSTVLREREGLPFLFPRKK